MPVSACHVLRHQTKIVESGILHDDVLCLLLRNIQQTALICRIFHRKGIIDKHHHAITLFIHQSLVHVLYVRSGKKQNQKDDTQTPEAQQENVIQPVLFAARRLQTLQQTHIGEIHPFEATEVEQMNDDRNSDGE